MRRLIFCFDGSWNKLSMSCEPTNVVLVAESIAPTDDKGYPQIVYYDEGVGTESDEVFRGGAFGKGIELNIREAYRFLIFNYQPGDEIFVFGFSRGAFTAMSFLGFIRLAGVLGMADARRIGEAWALYEKHAARIDDDPEEVRRFRAAYCGPLCIDEADRDWRAHNWPGFDAGSAVVLKVRYVGVWDTVGALGWRVVRATFDRRAGTDYKRHDTNLSTTVEAGRHAVALDERRVHFMPTLWRNVDRLNALAGKSSYADDAPFQQRWFPGNHTAVGGGGTERRLANGALHWVLEGAVRQGLDVNLAGRSQLRELRYDVRAPLRGTPAPGGLWHRLKAWLLEADRAGPEDVGDVAPAALRRWHEPASMLAERAPYRPATLRPLADRIAARKADFTPLEIKGGTRDYTVLLGETLSTIARDQLGDMMQWTLLFELNRDRLDTANRVSAGDVLRLPLGPPAPLNPD